MSFGHIAIWRSASDLDALERSLSKEERTLGQRMKKLERSKGMLIFLWITFAVLLLYAVFAFLYTTVVVYASGRGTSFLWFWPVTCVIALLAALGLCLVLTGRLPKLKPAAIGLAIAFWICMAVFLSVEAMIFSEGRKAAKTDAQYVIILGAQVRGEVPTLVLNARIKAAAEYLQEHPKAIAVASGGKGDGENISEAEAIKRGLMRFGISEDRILMEDASTSTAENLKFSAKLIQEKEADGGQTSGTQGAGTVYFVPKDVLVVTNDFHVYRAVRLAKNLGYPKATGLGATDFFAVTIQYYVREFFAVIAENLRGNF